MYTTTCFTYTLDLCLLIIKGDNLDGVNQGPHAQRLCATVAQKKEAHYDRVRGLPQVKNPLSGWGPGRDTFNDTTEAMCQLHQPWKRLHLALAGREEAAEK